MSHVPTAQRAALESALGLAEVITDFPVARTRLQEITQPPAPPPPPPDTLHPHELSPSQLALLSLGGLLLFSGVIGGAIYWFRCRSTGSGLAHVRLQDEEELRPQTKWATD